MNDECDSKVQCLPINFLVISFLFHFTCTPRSVHLLYIHMLLSFHPKAPRSLFNCKRKTEEKKDVLLQFLCDDLKITCCEQNIKANRIKIERRYFLSKKKQLVTLNQYYYY